MKVLSRDFTRKEKVLIVLLLLILVGLAYYQFLDQPVRQDIANAQAEQASLQTELDGLNAKIAVLEVMQREIDDLEAAGFVSIMPSYNSSKEELALLNDILADTQYTISFADVTRDGDQIRRSFSLQFTVHDYNEMEWILQQLTGSAYRCLLGDVRCSIGQTRKNQLTEELMDVITINATATFFETMVGGTADAALPADKAAAS